MAITVAELEARITIETKGFDAGIRRADQSMQQLATSATQAGARAGGLEGSLGKVGGALGAVATKAAGVTAVIGGGLVAGLGGAVRQATSFESRMSAVGAASQASGEDLARLRQLSLDLGKDLDLAGVGASDAAVALEELSKGGVSVADQLGGAGKGALLLFSAGAASVEEASGLAVKAMNIFGLSGKDVAHVADLLAAGANKSATDVGALGQAFNQSAAVAANAGLSIEELTGTLSFLAQRGMEGSDAGTSLKTALLALQAPTDVAARTMRDLGINVRDSHGQMLPFAEIADILQQRLGGLSDAQRDAALKTIFGNDAIRVGIALYEGGGQAISEWTSKVDDAGFAARIGAQRNDNLAGSFSQLMATIETGAIGIGSKFIPVLRTATDEGTKLIDRLLSSREAQAALDRLAGEGSAAIARLVATVSDPTFQRQVREWGAAALDTGKAIVTLAGDVKDTLGPVVTGAVRWFSDLDDQGRKNVVMFGLVAGSIAGTHKELSALLTIGGSVVKMFAEKEAAKRTLTGANATLAGSAGKTATAFDLVKTAVGGAVVALGAADLTIRALTHNDEDLLSFTASLLKYGDALHQGREGALRFQEAHQGSGQLGAYTDQIAALRQRYDELAATSAKFADPSVAALKDLLTGSATARNLEMNNILAEIDALERYKQGVAEAAFAEERHLRIQAGLAEVAGPFTREMLLAANGVGQLATGATAAAAALAPIAGPFLPALAGGLGQAAAAAGQLAVPVQASALALADLNLYGTPAQARLNELASGALALALQAAGLNAEYGRLATTFDLNTQAMQGVGGQSSMLGGYLGTLQAEWNALDEAVKRQGFTTDAQQARYEALAPLIQFLNAKQGEYKQTTIDLTARQVELLLKMDGLNRVVAEGGAKAQGASAAVGILNSALGGQKKAADDGAAAAQGHAGALGETTGAAIVAKGAIAGVGLAIRAVPKEFTVTAHVDISGALASIAELNAHLPHSPAEKGPFSRLPNWDALFDGFAAATGGALRLIDQFGARVQASLAGLGDGTVIGGGGGAVGAALAGVFDLAPAVTAWEHRALPQARTLTVVGEQIAERVRYGLDIVTRLDRTIADTLPGGAVIGGGGAVGAALAGVFDLAPAVTAWRGDALPQAEILRDAGRRIAETLAGGLDVFRALDRFLDTPQRVLGELYDTFDVVLDYGERSVFAADALKAQAAAFATAMQEAARLFTQGQAFGQTIGRVQGGAFPLPTVPDSPQFPGLTIPKLAEGGIVTKPTLALVGERGPEAVIPLARMADGPRGGGRVVYLSVNYYDHSMQGTDRARLASFARELQVELSRL